MQKIANGDCSELRKGQYVLKLGDKLPFHAVKAMAVCKEEDSDVWHVECSFNEESSGKEKMEMTAADEE